MRSAHALALEVRATLARNAHPHPRARSARSRSQVLVSSIATALAMQNLGEVGEELTRLCEFYDKEATGLLDPRVLKDLLQTNFSFLTRLQVNDRARARARTQTPSPSPSPRPTSASSRGCG